MIDILDKKDKFTILAVDDQRLNQEFIKSMLEDKYNIKSVMNAKSAFKVLEKFEIDLILLDIEMPEMDGFECTKILKEDSKTKHIPIIFLTSHQDKKYIIKGFQLGANDYITKPFNLEELTVRVENQLKTHYLLKKLESAYNNLEKFIETQNNIVFLTDGIELKFANKKLFDFFGVDSIEDFLKDRRCICESFIENDRFFHLGKIKEGENWIDVLQTLPQTQRVISLLGQDFIPYAFSVSINEYDENTSIVTFADISKTIENNIQLEDKVIHDQLTKAYNREFFENNIHEILTKFNQGDSKLAIALLDIDHFKSVNDTYGHDVGDEVLVKFVHTIQRYSRKEDILIRWGGEEFILLLKVSDEENLDNALEHLRNVVELQRFPKIGRKTCSIGGTIYQEGEDIIQTIKRADEAVYEAKSAGRNRVILL